MFKTSTLSIDVKKCRSSCEDAVSPYVHDVQAAEVVDGGGDESSHVGFVRDVAVEELGVGREGCS